MDDQLKAVLDAVAQIKGRALALPDPVRSAQLTVCSEVVAEVHAIQRELDTRREAVRDVAAERRRAIGEQFATVRPITGGR